MAHERIGIDIIQAESIDVISVLLTNSRREKKPEVNFEQKRVKTIDY